MEQVKQGDFFIFSWGPCYASVCTAHDDDESIRRLNDELPTGISSRWQIADEPFADGTPNPTPCPDEPATHRHVLFTC